MSSYFDPRVHHMTPAQTTAKILRDAKRARRTAREAEQMRKSLRAAMTDPRIQQEIT